MTTTPSSGPTDPASGDRPLPPYEGRKEAADIEEADESGEAPGMHSEGANVAGGQRPKESTQTKAPPPGETPRGEHAAPSEEETPAAEADEDSGVPMDEGVGPAHYAGTPKGENQTQDPPEPHEQGTPEDEG